MGSLIFLALACGLRLSVIWISCKISGREFRALDKPIPAANVHYDDNVGTSEFPYVMKVDSLQGKAV